MKRHLRNEILVHVDAARVSQVIADASRFFRCNPLVIAVEPDPRVAGAFTISDRMEILGATFRFSYRVAMVAVAGGFDFEVWAPLGTRLSTQWRLFARGDDTLVREDVELSAPLLMAAMVVRTTDEAHRLALKNLKRLVEESS